MKHKKVKLTHHEALTIDFNLSGFHEEVIKFYTKMIIEFGDKLHILDLGAGSGLVSKSLAQLHEVNKITAFDRSMEMMSQLKEDSKIEKVATGSHLSLPFDRNAFDVVVCRYTFHHLNNKTTSLKEIKRVLKRNGLFLYSDPVLPEHSKNVLNPLYVIREDHFHSYLTYYDTIDLLEQHKLEPFLSRPYRYIYDNFDKYLKAVDDGFSTGYSDQLLPTLNILKKKLRRAWSLLDDKVKLEMKIESKNGIITFKYYLVDIAAKNKKNN